MDKKYVLIDETITVNNKTLYRIKAIKDFNDVKAGDLGGFIEKEENLSHYYNSWVYGNAKVFDNAEAFDNAWVYGNAEAFDNAEVFSNAQVFGNAKVFEDAVIRLKNDYICFECVGSRNDFLTAFKTKDGYLIKVGCFVGTLEEFIKKVKEKHGETKIAREYLAIAKVIEIRFEE